LSDRAQLPCFQHCVMSPSFNPFTAEVAIMRLLGSAPMSHLCDQKRRSTVTGLSDLKTLFIDLGCLCCKQTQRAFHVFKNTLNWLKTDSVDQKFYWLECGNFSQDAGTPGTERLIAFSQLAVKGLKRLSSPSFKASISKCTNLGVSNQDEFFTGKAGDWKQRGRLCHLAAFIQHYKLHTK
jgi:hypothetical protein